MSNSTSQPAESPFAYIPGGTTEHYFPIDFDTLAQAVGTCLPGYLLGVDVQSIRVRNEQFPDGRIVFSLSHPTLGRLGTVEVRKKGTNRAALFLDDPHDSVERNSTASTLFEWQKRGKAQIALVSEGEPSLADIKKALDEERRATFWGRIIPGLYDRLQNELLHIQSDTDSASQPLSNDEKEAREIVRRMFGDGSSDVEIGIELQAKNLLGRSTNPTRKAKDLRLDEGLKFREKRKTK